MLATARIAAAAVLNPAVLNQAVSTMIHAYFLYNPNQLTSKILRLISIEFDAAHCCLA